MEQTPTNTAHAQTGENKGSRLSVTVQPVPRTVNIFGHQDQNIVFTFWPQRAPEPFDQRIAEKIEQRRIQRHCSRNGDRFWDTQLCGKWRNVYRRVLVIDQRPLALVPACYYRVGLGLRVVRTTAIKNNHKNSASKRRTNNDKS